MGNTQIEDSPDYSETFRSAQEQSPRKDKHNTDYKKRNRTYFLKSHGKENNKKIDRKNQFKQKKS